MYKLFFTAFTILLVVTGPLLAPVQETRTREAIVCHPTDMAAPDDMAAFANDPAFQALHLSPLPIVYAAQGEMVKIKTADGTDANAYLVKAKKKSDKWLFVYQEWWGLNDYIKMESDKFYAGLGEDVNVLALDMYDGKVTADPKEAGQFMQGVKEDRLQNIVKGAIAMAGKTAKIASVGWCFGGGWSLKSALLEGPQAVVNISAPARSVNDCIALAGAVPRLPAMNFTPSFSKSVCATLVPSAALYLLS